ncbi:dTDP-4-dehydrorhamnose 3,5-epimerase [Marinoscillum sp.]|uniref:dTDP-4-dehydrorhamnose 3,5-epimerase n=1 Tax=Marinoscillum sp. TaxID=2024838 RepID=UPI003BA92C83
MEVIETPLKDCFIIKTRVYGDERGFFLESFNQKALGEKGVHFDVKQINFAKSEKNVLRGLHYQKAPFGQTKLVGVISGAVRDVVVDIRKSSPTFGKHFNIEIDSQDTFLLIPKGFAHGYYTLADETIFYYAVDNFYSPENERGIVYNDPVLNVDWGLKGTPKISIKDQHQSLMSQAELFD